MSLIKHSKYAILLFSLVFWLGWAPLTLAVGDLQPGAEIPVEPDFVQLNIKNRFIDSFFEVLRGPEESIFLPLSKVLAKLELHTFRLDFAQGLVKGGLPLDPRPFSFDLKNGMMQRGKDTFILPKSQYLVQEDEVFLTLEALEKWLPMVVEWDEFLLEVAIYPDFKMVSEIFLEREEVRKELRKQQEVERGEVVQNPPSWFRPGVLNYGLNMSAGTMGLGGPELSLSYVGSLLMGDFVGQITMSPVNWLQLRTFQLKYRDLPGVKEAALGHTLLELPVLLGQPMVVRGVTVKSAEDLFRYGETRLVGSVPAGSDVELFYQGMLIAYQRATEGIYQFEEIPVRGAYNMYEIVVYTPEGQMYHERRYVLARDQQLQQGQYFYRGGAGLSKTGLVGSTEGYYGVNDIVTLGGRLSVLPTGKTDEAIAAEVAEDGGAAEEGSRGLGVFAGGEAIVKINPSTFAFLDTSLGLNGQGVAYRTGVQSALNSWTLKGSLLGYGGTGMPEQETAVVKNQLHGLGQEIGLEVEKNLARTVWGVGYRLAIFDEHLRHRLESRFGQQIGPYTYLRMEDALTFGPGGGWNNSLRANFTYSGAQIFDVHTHGYVLLQQGGPNYYALHLDMVSKKRSNLPLNYSAGLQVIDGELDLVGNVQYQYSDWLAVRGSVGLSSVSVSLNLRESRQVKMPFPKVKSETFGMGWVTGRVFLDENGNRILDEQEKVFQNVQMLVNDQPLGATDETGRFAVYGLKPYTPVKMGLDSTTLDALYLPVEEAVWIETRPGDALEMDFGVVPCSGITGNLRGTAEELEELGGKAAVVLLNHDGEEVERVEIEYDGFFLIDRVLPGSYLLRVSLPEDWEGRQIAEPTSYRIEVPYGEMPKWYDEIVFELGD